MRKNSLLILDYQGNFADDFSVIAYAKIMKKQNKNLKYFYENKTLKRSKFEEYMSNFNLDFDSDFDYISSKKVKDVAQKSYFLNNLFLKNEKLFNKYVKNNVLSKTHFEINDIEFISNEIKSMFSFKTFEFVKNYDILDEIYSHSSIGVFVSKDDELTNDDLEFISNSLNRLNKFLKQPKLFIFSKNKNIKIDTYIEYEIVDLLDWREEFYFLSLCRHHIVLDTKNSYSKNLWASIISKRDYCYTLYKKSKNIDTKKMHNWLFV